MMQSWNQNNGTLKVVSWLIAGVLADCVLGFGGLGGRAIAQNVIPDGSTVTNISDGSGNCIPSCDISGNTRDSSGKNLFHSFDRFNVPRNGRVNFQANGAENIFSRVTGQGIEFRSNIDGVLSAGANLFLLNPNGILFGPSAQLDIRGSFLASTADSFIFGDQSFSAIDPQPVSPLLTVNVPIGLQYGIAGAITSNGSNLAVEPGQSLILAGGTVTLNGGSLTAPGGRIELDAATAGRIDLNQTGSIFSLDFSNVLAQGDVRLENGAIARVTSANGGSISATGRDITFVESELNAGIEPGSGAVGSQAGDIILNASESVELLNSSINNRVNPGSIGDAGEIIIHAESLFLKEDSALNATTFGIGNPGDILITARNLVELDGTDGGAIFSTIEPGAIADSLIPSNINITANQISIKNGFEVQTLTATRGQPNPGQGDAGNITLIAQDSITLENDGSVFSNIQSGARGNGGIIEIRTGSLFIRSSSGLEASTSGIGNAGDVIVEARDIVELDDNSIIYSNVAEGGVAAESSIISITANEIFIRDSEIQALTEFRARGNPPGRGDAGDIFLIASGGITLEDKALVTGLVQEEVLGNSGDIHIRTGSLFMRNGSVLEAQTRGNGNAGDVIIVARDRVELDGDIGNSSRIISNVAEGGVATEPSIISITANEIIIKNFSEVQALTEFRFRGNPPGQGDAGDIFLIAPGGSITLANEALVTSLVQETVNGNSGDIHVRTGSLFISGRSELEALTRGNGNAGNVTVEASDRIVIDGEGGDPNRFAVTGIQSRVSDQATGNGGVVTIRTRELNMANETATLVVRTDGNGNAGTINIVDTDRVIVQDGARISVETTTSFDAGNVIIDANELVQVSGTDSGVDSRINLDTAGGGNAGQLMINSPRVVVRDGGAVSASTTGSGSGGLLQFNTSNLTVRDGGEISATTRGSGRGGLLRIRDADRVVVDGASIFFDAFGGVGNAGRIRIDATLLRVNNGGQVSASTSGAGSGGFLRVNTREGNILGRVIVEGADGGGAESQLNFDSIGSGDADGIRITTGELIVRDGARISASASSVGNAGILNVNATEQVTVEGSNSILSFDTSGSGNAEALIITTPQLTLREGGQVSIGTTGQGSAGLMTVDAAESVVVDGNGTRLTSNTSGSGNAGGIEITTGELIVQNRGQVTVSSIREQGYTGSLGNAGNLTVTADSIFLDDQGGRDLDDLGGLTAETRATSPSATGGNVTLTVHDRILMRNNSLISASARGTANGGNVEIVIPDGFVLASLAEDSDVVASAETGNGGRATAEANAVIGFRQFIDRRTPESDFTASSETGLPGIVEIDAEERLPEEIPQFVFQPRISRNCQAIANPNQSEFTITGRGGLPPNAEEAIATDNVQVDLVSPNVPELSGDRTPNSELQPSNAAIPDQIIEAQGWVVGETGAIQLVAAAPQVEPQSPAFTPVNCALLGAVE